MTYADLLACYKSGQMSDAQWIRTLAEDEVFRAWLKRRGE